MTKIDIVKAAVIALGTPDVSSFYSDDFQATDAVGGQPTDKNTWVGMSNIMIASFPDIEYVIESIEEEGSEVRLAGHFVGTFVNDLDLSSLGMGVIPASGRRITWPSDHIVVTIVGDKITKWHATDTGPDAGFPGFLKALGVG